MGERVNRVEPAIERLIMRILFFAHLKNVTGQAEVEWPGSPPLKTTDLWDRLTREWPALALHRHATRLACNGEYKMGDEVFQAGDEIALIPPVSGG